MCFIKSLQIHLPNYLIITDIDDCLIYSSRSIREHGLNKRNFYFDEDLCNEFKYSVFSEAELTEWGVEFFGLIKSGHIVNYKLITAAKNRIEILCEKFNINASNILENYSDSEKVIWLNSLKENSLYVDDKLKVISQVKNKNIECVNFPKKSSYMNNIKRNKYRNRF